MVSPNGNIVKRIIGNRYNRVKTLNKLNPPEAGFHISGV